MFRGEMGLSYDLHLWLFEGHLKYYGFFGVTEFIPRLNVAQ